MKLKTIGAAVLALLVVGAGAAAAVPGSAADQAQTHANDNAPDAGTPDQAADGEETADEADDGNESAAANASERRGPPTDMPEQVPDHVVKIHETINSWLDGTLNGSLGDAISDVVSQDGGTDDGQSESGQSEDDEDTRGNGDEQNTGEKKRNGNADN